MAASAGRLVPGAFLPSKPATLLALTTGTISQAQALDRRLDLEVRADRVRHGQLVQHSAVRGSARRGRGHERQGVTRHAHSRHLQWLAPFWNFSSGTLSSENLVSVSSGDGTVNTGVQPFSNFAVTFDVKRRTMFLSSQLALPPWRQELRPWLP
jgi:hypothetical protein